MKISHHIPHLNSQLWLSIKDLETLDRWAINQSAISLDLKDKCHFLKCKAAGKHRGQEGSGRMQQLEQQLKTHKFKGTKIFLKKIKKLSKEF